MSSLSEKSQALRVLEGLDAGTLSIADAYNILKDLDPVLVYFVLRYLKEKYPLSSEGGSAVQTRLLELTTTYDEIRTMMKSAERDVMRTWFDETYTMREFSRDAEGFVSLIVDKLDG